MYMTCTYVVHHGTSASWYMYTSWYMYNTPHYNRLKSHSFAPCRVAFGWSAVWAIRCRLLWQTYRSITISYGNGTLAQYPTIFQVDSRDMRHSFTSDTACNLLLERVSCRVSWQLWWIESKRSTDSKVLYRAVATRANAHESQQCKLILSSSTNVYYVYMAEVRFLNIIKKISF